MTHTNEIQSGTVDLTALAPLSDSVQVSTLAYTKQAGERDAAYSWGEPDRIRVELGKATLTGTKLAHRFPPLSLVVLEARQKSRTTP
jgi:hypothetical protein